MPEKKSMCIIMEYIDGGTMQRFCQEGCVILSDTDKNRIACSCWSGLAYLHEQKIIHKDIKPENIFVRCYVCNANNNAIHYILGFK